MKFRFLKKIIKNLLPYYIVKRHDLKKQRTINGNEFYYRQKGVCPVCNENVIFFSKNTWLRDFFRCTNCGSIPRQRALMLIIEKYYPDWRKLSIHEAGLSPEYYMSKKLPMECTNYIASQYYPQEEFGKSIDNYRNEDLEKQTFSDEIFDIVITQDVFEHLYNPEKALIEIARTLKLGGSHIFTVPLISKQPPPKVVALMRASKRGPLVVRGLR